ncbi:MAG: DUF192 domain-containing protein [Phycisphaerae bacterium]|nr:DUF192 domain-containing protein [Phycisphaerae bacterium]
MTGSCRQLRSRLGLWLGALCLPAAIAGCGGGDKGPPRVKIGGAVWDVDIALNDAQRLRGLAGRAYLDESVGMLFMYPKAGPRAYCMRDCLIPLDIAFIDSDLRIVNIYTMVAEPDRRGRVTYSSRGDAQYVLEVSAGGFGRNGVVEGAKVVFLGNIPPATKAEAGP